jgi:hypothetical protein
MSSGEGTAGSPRRPRHGPLAATSRAPWSWRPRSSRTTGRSGCSTASRCTGEGGSSLIDSSFAWSRECEGWWNRGDAWELPPGPEPHLGGVCPRRPVKPVWRRALGGCCRSGGMAILQEARTSGASAARTATKTSFTPVRGRSAPPAGASSGNTRRWMRLSETSLKPGNRSGIVVRSVERGRSARTGPDAGARLPLHRALKEPSNGQPQGGPRKEKGA